MPQRWPAWLRSHHRGCRWRGQFRCSSGVLFLFLALTARAVRVGAVLTAPRIAWDTAALRAGALGGVDDLVHRVPSPAVTTTLCGLTVTVQPASASSSP